MLILSRKPGEVIRIGDDIIITILSCDWGNIRVGIDAPKGVSVHRSEVYDRIKAGVPQRGKE